MPEDKVNQPTIAIIGLGVMGRQLGKALQQVKRSYRIIGHDRKSDRVRAAIDELAIDSGEWNLLRAAETADLVLITEAVDEACETLEQIAPVLRPGTLVSDTAPIKAPVLEVARRVMPEGVSFIGGHPIPRAGARELASALSAKDAPNKDGEAGPDADEGAASIFEGATYCLSPLPDASRDAMKVLGNLVATIGAEAFFIDAEEHDALVGGVGMAPYLAGLALLSVADRSPSSRDLQRLAGPALLDAIAMADEEAAAYREAAHRDPDGTVRWLDQLIATLGEMRKTLSTDPEAFEKQLDALERTRLRWLFPVDDDSASIMEEAAELSSVRQLLFGRRRQPPTNNHTGE